MARLILTLFLALAAASAAAVTAGFSGPAAMRSQWGAASLPCAERCATLPSGSSGAAALTPNARLSR
jgi:hypothetical protein